MNRLLEALYSYRKTIVGVDTAMGDETPKAIIIIDRLEIYFGDNIYDKIIEIERKVDFVGWIGDEVSEIKRKHIYAKLSKFLDV